jgi:hypothetical protein
MICAKDDSMPSANTLQAAAGVCGSAYGSKADIGEPTEIVCFVPRS